MVVPIHFRSGDPRQNRVRDLIWSSGNGCGGNGVVPVQAWSPNCGMQHFPGEIVQNSDAAPAAHGEVEA